MHDHMNGLPNFSRSRNDALTETDLRAKTPKFIVDVIDAELAHRVRTTDPKASRNGIINEILLAWANEQWHRATMTLKIAPINPYAGESNEEEQA
ncbi:MAG: hypothetical protein LBE61_09550 [Burkholderiaceae bacterium]|jgi:hypothetical protein|nr:hypothetical protein [Burkholderiaceae bacterium]